MVLLLLRLCVFFLLFLVEFRNEIDEREKNVREQIANVNCKCGYINKIIIKIKFTFKCLIVILFSLENYNYDLFITHTNAIIIFDVACLLPLVMVTKHVWFSMNVIRMLGESIIFSSFARMMQFVLKFLFLSYSTLRLAVTTIRARHLRWKQV